MKRLIVHYFLIFVLSLLSQVSHAERTENINAQCAVHMVGLIARRALYTDWALACEIQLPD